MSDVISIRKVSALFEEVKSNGKRERDPLPALILDMHFAHSAIMFEQFPREHEWGRYSKRYKHDPSFIQAREVWKEEYVRTHKRNLANRTWGNRVKMTTAERAEYCSQFAANGNFHRGISFGFDMFEDTRILPPVPVEVVPPPVPVEDVPPPVPAEDVPPPVPAEDVPPPGPVEVVPPPVPVEDVPPLVPAEEVPPVPPFAEQADDVFIVGNSDDNDEVEGQVPAPPDVVVIVGVPTSPTPPASRLSRIKDCDEEDESESASVLSTPSRFMWDTERDGELPEVVTPPGGWRWQLLNLPTPPTPTIPPTPPPVPPSPPTSPTPPPVDVDSHPLPPRRSRRIAMMTPPVLRRSPRLALLPRVSYVGMF